MEAQSDYIFPSLEQRLLHFRRSCSGCAVYVHLCVRAHTRDRILPLCPSLHCCIGKEETPFSPPATQVFLPASLVFPIAMLPSTTALNENGLRNLPSKKKKIPGQIPKVPPQLPPRNSPIWILLGKLAPTTAPRKPVQKKAKMYGIFLFTLAKKKPWSNHRFGLPSPSFDSSCCSAGSFSSSSSLLASFLPPFLLRGFSCFSRKGSQAVKLQS